MPNWRAGRARHRRVVQSFIAVTLISGLALVPGIASAVPAGSPSVAEREAGLWYLDAMDAPAARDQGLTGKGVRIAVVDTGINLQAAELQGANITVHDGFCLNQDTRKPIPGDSPDPEISEHGTGVVAMLVGNGKAADGGLGAMGIVPDAQIDFYAVGPLVTEEQEDRGWFPICPSEIASNDALVGDSMAAAFAAAVASGAPIVSMSARGNARGMLDSLIDAAARGVVVVGSSLNPGDSSLEQETYPGAANGSVNVGTVGSDGLIVGRSADLPGIELPQGARNPGVVAPGLNILTTDTTGKVGIMHGSSYATPLVAGALGLFGEKYPSATRFQAVQAMVDSADTGTRDAATSTLMRLQYGSGQVSLAEMLALDPAGLPDENPLFVKDPSDPRCKSLRDGTSPTEMIYCTWSEDPTLEQVQAAQKALAASPSPGEAGTNSGSGSKDTGFPIGILVIVLVGLVVVAAAIVIPVAVLRRARLAVPGPEYTPASLPRIGHQSSNRENPAPSSPNTGFRNEGEESR